MKKVKRAVIAAAGMGTRFLPHSKAVPKEMLPLINKPVIQLVVEDLVAAGVDEIIIVTNDTKKAIEDHFDYDRALAAEQASKGKIDQVKQLVELTRKTKFVYLRQKGTPLGNARPLINAAHMLMDEPFFFYFADDFFKGSKTTAQQLLAAHQQTGSTIVALFEPAKNMLDRYGIAEVKSKQAKLVEISQIVEKPTIKQAPSKLAVGGGYLFTPEVLPLLKTIKPGPTGEMAISEVIVKLATVYGLPIDGDYYDTGTPEAYLNSLIRLTLADSQRGPALKQFLKQLVTTGFKD